MIKLFFIVLALLAAAIALLAINIILRKNGSFRSQDVGQNPEMQRRGIHCTRAQDRIAQQDNSSIKDMMKPDAISNL